MQYIATTLNAIMSGSWKRYVLIKIFRLSARNGSVTNVALLCSTIIYFIYRTKYDLVNTYRKTNDAYMYMYTRI